MIKFYAIGGLIIALLLAGWKIESQRSSIDRLDIENSLLSDTNDSLKEQVMFELKQNGLHVNRSKLVSERLVKSEEQLTYIRGVFNQHDFGNLLNKKPQLITKIMIKGSAKVLKELEDASN